MAPISHTPAPTRTFRLTRTCTIRCWRISSMLCWVRLLYCPAGRRHSGPTGSPNAREIPSLAFTAKAQAVVLARYRCGDTCARQTFRESRRRSDDENDGDQTDPPFLAARLNATSNRSVKTKYRLAVGRLRMAIRPLTTAPKPLTPTAGPAAAAAELWSSIFGQYHATETSP